MLALGIVCGIVEAVQDRWPWAWPALGVAFVLSALLACASVSPSKVCLDDGTLVLPTMQTRFISAKLEVSCHTEAGYENTAKLTLESSQWIWAAVGSLGAALIAVVQNDPPLAPDLTPEEQALPKTSRLTLNRSTRYSAFPLVWEPVARWHETLP